MSFLAAPEGARRVKVYELCEERWVDRGTGYCTGRIERARKRREIPQEHGNGFLTVKSEEDNSTILLRSRINKEDEYQKQQETLIVWTGSTGVDMALSFQEAEGCREIWDFLLQVQNHLTPVNGSDEVLSDENETLVLILTPVTLPIPSLENLHQIETVVREASLSVGGRESLAKFVLHEVGDFN